MKIVADGAWGVNNQSINKVMSILISLFVFFYSNLFVIEVFNYFYSLINLSALTPYKGKVLIRISLQRSGGVLDTSPQRALVPTLDNIDRLCQQLVTHPCLSQRPRKSQQAPQ